MNYGALIFLAAFFCLSASWFGFVLTPQIQLGGATQATNVVNTTQLHPIARPGLAQEGLQVYRANACYYCHSQQVGQTGTQVNFILSKAGTNPVAVAEALLNANVGLTNANAAGISAGLPKTILRNAPINNARKAAKAVKDAGGEGSVEIVAVGPDIPRWGVRRSVAQDFLYDNPVMLGSQRIGPDLANVGARLPDPNWHLRHLYAPRVEVADSAMPAYKFLFKQRKINGLPSPDALQFAGDSAPKIPEGFEIVPTDDAKTLVAYLLSLNSGAPVFEVPVGVTGAPPPVETTNSPAQ
jgi:cbb3-type cytochrome oxidase cytochrome c subunit